MLELENDNLNEILSANEKVFVMFGASWCGACKMTKPKVKRMAGENENVQFIYADAEFMTESRALVGKMDNLPTFVAFNSGAMVAKEPGTKSIDKVLNSLN
jgi:thiol-disulfide isomerase/thioredoxin